MSSRQGKRLYTDLFSLWLCPPVKERGNIRTFSPHNCVLSSRKAVIYEPFLIIVVSSRTGKRLCTNIFSSWLCPLVQERGYVRTFSPHNCVLSSKSEAMYEPFLLIIVFSFQGTRLCTNPPSPMFVYSRQGTRTCRDLFPSRLCPLVKERGYVRTLYKEGTCSLSVDLLGIQILQNQRWNIENNTLLIYCLRGL